jgi:hypothetical protein
MERSGAGVVAVVARRVVAEVAGRVVEPLVVNRA